MNKKRIYEIVLSLFLILGMANALFAQKFSASVNKNKVTVGEVFQLDFSINANGKDFTPPSLNEFNVHSGPNQSTSMQIINGSISQSISLSYYLSAKKEGTFTIGSATIEAGNTTLRSNPITILVTKGENIQQGQGGDRERSGVQSGQNLFARTSVSKSKCYIGEQIIITHRVYTRLDLKGFQDLKFPSYDGFWAQEVNRQTQYEVTVENIDGVQYNVVEIKKAFLFAQRSGKIEIEPLEAQCVIREKGARSNDPFEQFFGFGAYKDVPYTIKSNPVRIEVLPLPEEDKPADFPGAVGDFSMNATIDKDNVKTNDGINMKITISGKGNLKLIDVPKINFPDGVESYDPKTYENISVTANGVAGSKTFEYLLIPRHEGIYKIEPWDFNYFDTDRKKYVTLPSKEFIITVEKGENNSSSVSTLPNTTKEDVKLISNDIRFIKTDNIALSKKDEYFFGSLPFVAGFILSPLLFCAFLFFRREHLKRNSDLVLVKKRNANRIAKKHLVQAEQSMKANDKENFFINILSALYTYAGNKMNIPVAELSKEKMIEILKEKNVPSETISDLVKLLDECEFARYAPGLQSGNLQEVYNKASNNITQIENSIA